MSITHYFSKNQDKRAKYIFNKIARIYSRFDGGLQKNFENSFSILKKEMEIEGRSILDIGSGTGAWSSLFLNNGAGIVQGVDLSEQMILQARKNHPKIKFSLGNGELLSDFNENSFDIVTSSYVLHGFTSDKREKMLKEMKRVTRKHIVIQDFIGKTPALIKLLEILERSDYKRFKKNICRELKMIFPKTKIIPVKYGSGLYIAEKF